MGTVEVRITLNFQDIYKIYPYFVLNSIDLSTDISGKKYACFISDSSLRTGLEGCDRNEAQAAITQLTFIVRNLKDSPFLIGFKQCIIIVWRFSAQCMQNGCIVSEK